jgi:hypothetical protein
MPEMPEPIDVIAEGELFSLVSCGNGTVYVLRSKEDKTSTSVEGEDIAAFLAEYENTKSAYPDYSTDQTLAQLWDQGGYSWMAVPDGE